MLLQRGHGSTFSGFFRVFSCGCSCCSFSDLSSLFDFVASSSSSMEGVSGFTMAEFLASSAFGGGSASCSPSVTPSASGS